MQKECFIFRPFIKIHGQLCKMSIFVKFAIIFSRFKKWPRKIYSHLLSLRFASNTRFMYIYELMMTEWSQFVISMGSKYSKVGINNLACRLCSKWCQTFGGRCRSKCGICVVIMATKQNYERRNKWALQKARQSLLLDITQSTTSGKYMFQSKMALGWWLGASGGVWRKQITKSLLL